MHIQASRVYIQDRAVLDVVRPCAAANPAWRRGLQSVRPVGRVAELGALGGKMNTMFQDGPEAREWLKWNGHEAALASNRFRSTAEGIAPAGRCPAMPGTGRGTRIFIRFFENPDVGVLLLLLTRRRA